MLSPTYCAYVIRQQEMVSFIMGIKINNYLINSAQGMSRPDVARPMNSGGHSFVRLICVLMIPMVFPLAGCSYFSSGDTTAAEITDPPGRIFAEGDAAMSAGKFGAAAKKFEEVDREHPYSPFARRAIVMAAFSHFKNGQYNDAIKGGRRYTTLHPGTKEAALAHHIIASSYFAQIKDPTRDQRITKAALKELEILVRRYPDSEYAKTARNRIRVARDVLAASEMNVGRYYLRRQNYLAAVNRFKKVVSDYQTTAHVEEALMRLTEAYMALGVRQEAQTAAAVLGHNFPNSKWYKDAYALLASDGLAPRQSSSSWMSKVWKGTVKSVSSLNPF